MARKTVYEDCDILVVGGGMAGTVLLLKADIGVETLKLFVLRKLTSIEVVL